MRIEFEKKFFSGKFEKNIFSENCETFFSRFSQGGGQLLCKFGYKKKISLSLIVV